jgi:Leucine rich repeat
VRFIKSIFAVVMTFSTFLSIDSLILECDYSVRSNWRIFNVYTCTGKVLLVGDPQVITEVSTNHLNSNNNNYVRSLLIENQSLRLIPKNISNFFPNLESLNINRCGIEKIEREDLSDFPNLLQLHLNPNRISEIGNNLFEGNSRLKFITFSGNPIKHVAQNVFDDLKELEYLDIEAGTCVSQITRNRDQVLSFMFKLAVNCPPTFDMNFERIEAKLGQSNALKQVIDDQVSKEIDPIKNQTQEWWRNIKKGLVQSEKNSKFLDWLKEFFGLKEMF